jgi:2-polyprenyl-6-methoxyphenol hydroxylase-like FAD-dependent oxidoreductase
LNPQVLIVGAGPTGLALAAQLLRAGVHIRVIDKKSGPSRTSKAIGLQYRVSEILACMGVVDRFLARGGTPTSVNILAGNHQLVRLTFEASGRESGRDAFRPKAIVIPQSETEKILGEVVRERGGQIEWNTEFVEFRQNGDGVVSRIRAEGAENEVDSNFLVSCEGAHSLIREQAGIDFMGKTYPLAFFLADVELNGPLKHGENYVWMHKDGSFAALPLPTPRTWRFIVDVTTNPPAGEVTLDIIRRLMIERTGQHSIRIENPTWISEFKIHCRMVDRFRSGRVFVAGDAAHVHSPTGGQGIVTGIQDASNLAWKLARVLDGAPTALLDSYEEERKPQAAEVLQETDRTTRLLLSPRPFDKLVRDFVILPILRNRWMQKKLFAKLAQLHVNYRGSSLSQHQDATHSILKAGDRAPDVAFQSNRSGKPTTLFALLQRMRPIVLTGIRVSPVIKNAFASANIDLHGVGPHADNNGEHLIDVYGDFRRLYGMSGQFLCLIRPDDHIGIFQRRINESDIIQYLSKISRMSDHRP